MRGSAVRDCLRVFEHFGLNPASGEAIDVGGTREVHLSDRGHAKICENPLLSIHPRLKMLDRGFNAEDIGTSADEELDFLKSETVSHLFGKFDRVFCFDTLEHVSDPFLFCENLINVAAPGGAVYLSTIFSWVYHPSPEDYFRFSPTGLEQCFMRSQRAGDAKILWSGWETDERGVAILVAREPTAAPKSGSFDLREGLGPAGMLPPMAGEERKPFWRKGR
ncbi:MAG TPA: hypothetical protein VEX38_10755 [Fimbriimonadaceae bacterium]|nr:hypothetical protein [Fimbriimonadaceae bacterium]